MHRVDYRRCSACGELSITMAVTEQPLALAVGGVVGCALLCAWEFALTLRSPLEPISGEEAREYRRNWVITAVVTLAAIGSVTVAAMRL